MSEPQYRYEVRIDDKLRKPVVIYVKRTASPRVTVHTIRSESIEEAEAEARQWIEERRSSE